MEYQQTSYIKNVTLFRKALIGAIENKIIVLSDEALEKLARAENLMIKEVEQDNYSVIDLFRHDPVRMFYGDTCTFEEKNTMIMSWYSQILVIVAEKWHITDENLGVHIGIKDLYNTNRQSFDALPATVRNDYAIYNMINEAYINLYNLIWGLLTTKDFNYKKDNHVDMIIDIIKQTLTKVVNDGLCYEYFWPINFAYGKSRDDNTQILYRNLTKDKPQSSGGCYVATCVYGSYNCPEVWVLRRYRDYHLQNSVLGRLFIKMYYYISPKVVKRYGQYAWFKNFFRGYLDKKVERLEQEGYSDSPYDDLY